MVDLAVIALGPTTRAGPSREHPNGETEGDERVMSRPATYVPVCTMQTCPRARGTYQSNRQRKGTCMRARINHLTDPGTVHRHTGACEDACSSHGCTLPPSHNPPSQQPSPHAIKQIVGAVPRLPSAPHQPCTLRRHVHVPLIAPVNLDQRHHQPQHGFGPKRCRPRLFPARFRHWVNGVNVAS